MSDERTAVHSFGGTLRKKGREAAGLLKEKLSHSRSDATTQDILFVFEQMAIQKAMTLREIAI
jgi:hypothetical protein